MAIQALNEQEISEKLKEAGQWRREGSEIVRTFEFKGFLPAISFVNNMAEHAERVNHHPDIFIQYNKITLRLSTHDANGLTQRDFAFAQAADEQFKK